MLKFFSLWRQILFNLKILRNKYCRYKEVRLYRNYTAYVMIVLDNIYNQEILIDYGNRRFSEVASGKSQRKRLSSDQQYSPISQCMFASDAALDKYMGREDGKAKVGQVRPMTTHIRRVRSLIWACAWHSGTS